MAITQRAQRRLILLVLVFSFLAAFVLLASTARNFIRARNASDARVEGMALFEQGKYKESLPKLSMAVASDKKDAELVATLAEARSKVVSPGGKYLTTAIDMFLVALSLDPQNETYLEKLLELQVRASRLAQIIDTANKLLEINPANPMPVKILLEISEFRGRIGSLDEDGNTVEEDSALFWQEKLIGLYPLDIWHRLSYLALLNQIGTPKSIILDVANSWETRTDSTDGRFKIILAQVQASADMPDEAIRLARLGVSEGLDDPKTLLLAIEIMGQLNLQDDVAELKNIAKERALQEPDLARAIIVQAWRNGVTSSVLKYINDYGEVLSQNIDDTIFLLKLGFGLGNTDVIEKYLPVFAEQNSAKDISVIDQTNIDLWNQFFTALQTIDIVDSGQKEILSTIEQIKPVSEQLSDREFIWFIIARLYQRAGLTEASFDAYKNALDSSGILHVVPGRSLIEGLLANGRPMEALVVSEMLVRRHPQSLGAFNAWVRTRAAMERAGISAAEEGAVLRPFESAYSITQVLPDLDDSNISFELLYVETALASELYEDAAVHVANIIDNPNVSSSELVTLAKLSSDYSSSEQRLELLDAILKIMSENEAEYDSVDLVTIIYAAELRKLNRFNESEDLITSHFAGRVDEKSKRLLALEAVDLSIAKQSEALSEDIEALLSLDLDFKTIQNLMNQKNNCYYICNRPLKTMLGFQVSFKHN